MNLDADQQKVVNLNNGYYSILAGAGSGKSTVLLYRTARLYMEDPARKILCVTFTSEAAKNLRTRATKSFPTIEPSVFSTLHALALKFAVNHPESFPFHLSENPLADEGLSARAVFDSIGDKINFRAFTSWVSFQKRNRISPIVAVQQAERTGQKLDFAIGYKRYQSLLKKQGILDFDDLIYYMVDILEGDTELRRKWQYHFVMQDEAQDACELDWKLLQLLTERRNNLLCVGDSGQALYGFRGGAAHHLLNMEEMFPGTETLILGKNYRSLPGIVDAGKKAYPYPLISHTFTAVRNGSATVSIIPTANEFREAEEVILRAKTYIPEETAILSRTNLALRAIEEQCLEESLQYHILGDSGFWESPEVENILYYLRATVLRTDNAILGAIRTPFLPTKYVKKKLVVEKIKALVAKGHTASEVLQQFPELADFRSFLASMSYIRNVPADEAISSLIKHLKAVEHYSGEDNVNPDRNPIANLKELARAAKKHANPMEFIEFLRKLSYARKQRKGICLSTIHQAKGKEWKNVFLISANEGILPHIKALDDIPGEKCCFFVAVSRAEDNLYISYYDSPSRFLNPFLKVEDGKESESPSERNQSAVC